MARVILGILLPLLASVGALAQGPAVGANQRGRPVEGAHPGAPLRRRWLAAIATIFSAIRREVAGSASRHPPRKERIYENRNST